MILILGGTTEGRTAVKVADEAGKPYFYSTKGEWQEIQCKHGIRITGGMDTEKMESFCRQNNIRLLVDASALVNFDLSGSMSLRTIKKGTQA